MRIGPNSKTAKACVAALVLAMTPLNAWADASQTFYERSFVLAVHEKCRLFTPGVAAALTAATRQARGAALRGGGSDRDLSAAAARARSRAGAVSCADPDLAIVRGRVDHAFAGWSRMPRMTFPGGRADWLASRATYDTPTWALKQEGITGASPVTFGYATGAQYGPSVAVSFVGRPRPRAVRVVMRDPALSPRAWVDRSAGLPPASLRRAIWSSGQSPTDPALLRPGAKAGETWRFPASLAQALEPLDPRETFVVEFVFRDDSVARAVFEVGDFAAARAFLAMGPV